MALRLRPARLGLPRNKSELGKQELRDSLRTQPLFKLLSDPRNEMAQRFIDNRLTPMASRLKLTTHIPTRASRWSLVTEKRIRYEGKIPVTSDSLELS